jgi:hypothetical protein
MLFKIVTSKIFSNMEPEEVSEIPTEEVKLDIQTLLVFGLLYCKGSG